MSKDGGVKRGKWYGPWASYFRSLLDERKISDGDFAKICNDSQATMWQYCNGDINAPLPKLEYFSVKLRLDDAEKAKFFRLARLAHTPPEIQAEFEDLRAERDSLAAKLSASRKVAEQSAAEIAALRKVLEDQGVDLARLDGQGSEIVA